MGLVLGRNGYVVSLRILVVGAALCLLLLALRSSQLWWFCMVLALGVGMARGYWTQPRFTPLGQRLDRTVDLLGTVADDPGKLDSGLYQFGLAVERVDGVATSDSVKVSTTNRLLQRGYRIALRCKLKPSLGSIQYRCSYGQLAVLSTTQSPLERWRQRWFAVLHSLLPGDLAGFVIGLLVGARSLIPKSLQDELSRVGLSHLVAVSGYNLTILVRAVARVRGLSLFVSTAVSFWLIAGFLAMAGTSASIVRAAMVSGLSILGGYYGIKIPPFTLLAVPAAITAGYRPDYLTSDLGWQLSFVAFFGVLVVSPLVEANFVKRGNAVKGIVIESTAAHLVTAPLIMAIFGNFSVVAPLANAVVLPTVPLAMLLGFGTGVVGMAAPLLAGWISLPTTGLLALMIAVIHTLSQPSWANAELAISRPVMWGWYALMLVGCWLLWLRARRRQIAPDKL